MLAPDVWKPPTLKIAIVYFGMPRAIPATWQSHATNLKDVLKEAGISYKIFYHSWKTAGPYRVWAQEHEPPGAEDYRMLQPNYYRCDDQDEFTRGLRFADYFYEDVWRARGDSRHGGEWRPELVLNHLCALESQRRAFNMVLDTRNAFDAILLVRPDALLEKPFPVRFLQSLQPKTVYVPDFKHNEGVNDRMAFGDMAAMRTYMCRIEGAAAYRAAHGRIVSEKYLRDVLDTARITVTKFQYEFEFARPRETALGRT
jgi:hypothetical protein